ncbi:Heat shock 70 kDa protein 12A [Ilyodon furcidens]|uniref:Heat shock 70 kDa protein 12A n=1 Tax=Ilyodon furcidens TaxID=33524 RepID=A0ABV0VBN9_9TELE
MSLDCGRKPEYPGRRGAGAYLQRSTGEKWAKEHVRRNRQSRTFLVENVIGELWSELEEGDRYVVMDCGGGTVDLTVHQIRLPEGHLKELYKASGGPYGSIGVDYEFEKLLCKIFGQDFIDQFKIKRPAAWVDLMIAFESRKRAAAPERTNALNINLPFSFIDYYKKFRGHSVDHALRKSKNCDMELELGLEAPNCTEKKIR